jgi:integrase
MPSELAAKHFAIKTPHGIMESLQAQPDVADIRRLYLDGRFKELAGVPVSVDGYGKVISRLGDLIWDLWPYHVLKGADNLAKLNFSFLKYRPEMLLEVQMLFYVWVRIRGSSSRKKKSKTATLFMRLAFLKFPLKYLQEKSLRTMTALCEGETWAGFKTFLRDSDLSFGVLYQIVSALRATACVNKHLPFSFQLPEFKDHKLCRELAAEGRKTPVQTFSIPQRLADLIYGDALAMVETAWPHRGRIAGMLQQGCGRNRKVSPELMLLTGGRSPTQLLTACYICTLAFSGMRPSEAYQLQPGCYAAREVGATVFHVLVSATDKSTDGLKPDEWLCSPGAGKAVELAEALTRNSRNKLLAVSETHHKAGHPGEAQKVRRLASCLWLEFSKAAALPKADSGQMGWRLHQFVDKAGATVTEEDLREFRLVNHQVPAARVPRVGQPWPFTSRQTRRTFAVFARRYNLAGISAIKQQFKHLIVRISEYYSRGSSQVRAADARLDTELMDNISKYHVEEQASALYLLFNGDQQLCGGAGRTIMQWRQSEPLRYRSWETVRKLVEQGRLTYHSTGLAGCLNGYRCPMEGIVNQAFCVECDGAVITIEHAQNWQAEHAALVNYLRLNPTTESEFSHYLLKIRGAEMVMRDLGIAFNAYDPGGRMS